jgi:hypothetical protein
MAINGIRGEVSVGGEAAGVQQNIKGVIDTLKGLAADLSGLIQQLQAEAKNRPDVPQTSKLAPEVAAKLMSDYQARLQTWKDTMESLHRSIKDRQKQIADKQQELGALQTSDLPAAQARDAEKARQEAEAVQKTAESSLRDSGHSIEERSDSRAEEAALERRTAERAVRMGVTPARGIPERH